MTVLSIVHGDDADGLTCGAFLKRVKGSDVYLANYDNLENALQKALLGSVFPMDKAKAAVKESLGKLEKTKLEHLKKNSLKLFKEWNYV